MMQISISKIFGTIKTLYTLMFLLTALLCLTILSEFVSFNKLNNLQNEKEIATTVFKLGREDLDLASIQFRGKNTLLRHESNALNGLYEYDYINKFSKEGNYHNELNKLKSAIKHFNTAAGEWYAQEALSDAELQKRNADFTKSYELLMTQINDMITQNALFEKRRFLLEVGLSGALLLLLLFSMFTVPRRLNVIEKDLKVLASSDIDDSYAFATQEADTISKSVNRTTKTPTTTNPAYLDSVSGISNYKGFLHEANSKKSQKLGNYTAVCIFAIDRLNELETRYPQEFAEALIKKVSFMLSLYRQHNDVIGRLDHNQFAIYLTRQDKTSAINDCELIRKSVEETPFKSADGKTVNITLSGGFVQKMSTDSLEEIITKANKVLSMSIHHGGNRIAQLRDKSTALK